MMLTAAINNCVPSSSGSGQIVDTKSNTEGFDLVMAAVQAMLLPGASVGLPIQGESGAAKPTSTGVESLNPLASSPQTGKPSSTGMESLDLLASSPENDAKKGVEQIPSSLSMAAKNGGQTNLAEPGTILSGNVISLVQTINKSSPGTGAASAQNYEKTPNPLITINGELLPKPPTTAQNNGQMPAVVLETSLTGSIVPLVQTASKSSPATGAAADQNRETALNPAAINGESLPQPSINAQNKGQMPLSGIEFNQAVAADSENRVKKAFTVDEMARLAGEKFGVNNKSAKATEPDSPGKVEQLKPGLGTEFDCAIENSPHPNAVPDKSMLSNANFAESSKNAALPDLKDRLVQEIRSVLAAGRGEQQSRVQLKLSPEHLGQLTIQLFFNGDELSAHFYTGNNHVKEILEGSLQQLRDSLNQHELKLNEALVFAGDDGRGGDMGRSFEEHNRPAWSANNRYYNHTYAGEQVEPVDLSAIATGSSRVNYLI